MALATNVRRAGFQFYGPADGSNGMVQPIQCVVITSKPDTYDLYPGDPVKAVTGAGGATANVASSYVTHCAPTEDVYGVVKDVIQYKRSSDGVVVRNGCKYLPADTTWTNWGDRSIVTVWPAQSSLFIVDADAALTYITDPWAAINKNCEMLAVATAAAAANQTLGLSGQQLDISTIATTATLTWRIVGIPNQVGDTPSGDNGKFIVRANLVAATGAPVGSETGV